MNQNWSVTARRPWMNEPEVLCSFATEPEARREHDRLVKEEPDWRFGILGYAECSDHLGEEDEEPPITLREGGAQRGSPPLQAGGARRRQKREPRPVVRVKKQGKRRAPRAR